MNPFEEKPQKIEKSFQSWKNVLVKPYDKQTVDPYTRLRVILIPVPQKMSARSNSPSEILLPTLSPTR